MMNRIALLIAMAFTQVAAFAADFESILKVLNENLITDPIENEEIVAYRFTSIPTFNHPYIIKVFKTPEGFQLVRKVASGYGGYDPGFLAETVRSDVTDAAIAELDKLLRDLKFHEMPSKPDTVKLDPRRYILEVVKNGECKIVRNWDPPRGDALIQLEQWFLKTSGWKPQKPK